jgi:hypothetical protein
MGARSAAGVSGPGGGGGGKLHIDPSATTTVALPINREYVNATCHTICHPMAVGLKAAGAGGGGGGGGLWLLVAQALPVVCSCPHPTWMSGCG